MILNLYQSLQKNKALLSLLASEKKLTKLNDAFKEIGTWRKAINMRSTVVKDGLVFDESFFFEVNLLREV